MLETTNAKTNDSDENVLNVSWKKMCLSARFKKWSA